MKKSFVLMTCVAATFGTFAALEPISPAKGEIKSLLYEVQKKIMAMPTYEERLQALQADAKIAKKEDRFFGRHSHCWRQAEPLVLKWRATAKEQGPWTVELGKSADLKSARVWYFSDKEIKPGKDGVCSKEIAYANLEIGTPYYWRVTGRNKGDGKTSKKEDKLGHVEVASSVANFVTEDIAPRWIAIEGRVANMRDLGGRVTTSGKKVRQGMAYRGQGLNDNSVTGVRKGRNRLTMEDVAYLTGDLGIKTDLDLRSSRETADLAVSPLGKEVKFIHNSSSCYAGIFEKSGMEVMAKNFRVFCNKANYPIYFHCIAGADRTGSLAYILNGVLGVDRHELETDWESTFYPTFPEMRRDYSGEKYWCREQHFTNGISKYGKDGDSWQKRIELYLLACGVKPEEIAAFRSIMLED